MRHFRTFLLLGAAVLQPLAAQNLSTQQKIDRILDLTNSASIVDQVVAQIGGMMETIQPNPTPQQKARRQEALDKIAKLARDRMTKIRPQLAKEYADTFTPEEIDGLLAFYETPAGQASLKKIPAINARMAALAQIELTTLGPEIDKIAQDALKK